MEPLSRSNPEVPANVTDLQAFREHIAKEGLINHTEMLRQRHEIRTAQQYLALALGHPLSFATDLTTRLMIDFVQAPNPAAAANKKDTSHKIIFRARRLIDKGFAAIPIDHDPFEELFDDGFADLSERWTHVYSGEHLAQQEHAMMILRQLHRITLQNPALNTRAYPRIPAAIERILKSEDPSTPPTPPREIS